MKRLDESTVTDDQIRHLFNASRDGTATDAIIRHACQVALSECVVFDDTHPSKHRYPDADERTQARRRCAEIIARRQS